MSTRVIDEIPYGVYVAKTIDGKYITNQDGDLLNIVSKKGDPKRIAQIKQYARHIGFDQIQLEFRGGARRVTEEEFEEMLERQQEGKVADPYDLGVLIDDYKRGKKQ